MTRFGTQTIWEGLEPVQLDTNRLEYLFESKGSSTCFNVASARQVGNGFDHIKSVWEVLHEVSLVFLYI